MKQPIPKISEKDLQQIIDRDFNENQREIVFSKLLKCLPKQGNDSEKNRILADILKLANGSIQLIDQYVNEANFDWRNVVIKAEYPAYSKIDLASKTSETKKKAIEQDWQQYQEWLKK